MKSIVRRKDSTALCALMAHDFKVEFDVGKGPDVFRRQWDSETSTTAVWAVLDRLLSLGGTFYSNSLFAAPYVYTRFPYDLDRLSHVVATGDVPVYAESNLASARVGMLKHAIVPLATPLTPPAMLWSAAVCGRAAPRARTLLRRRHGRLQPRGSSRFLREATGEMALAQPRRTDARHASGAARRRR